VASGSDEGIVFGPRNEYSRRKLQKVLRISTDVTFSERSDRRSEGDFAVILYLRRARYVVKVHVEGIEMGFSATNLFSFGTA